jgi:sugar/nucleoside kinase (ribokinase family)
MKMNVKKDAEFDVCALGSALLDFTVEADAELLEKFELNKGEMHLIGTDSSIEILSTLESFPMTITPGGSSANTAAGIMNYSGKAVFNGKVGNDKHGEIYIRETEKTGVISEIKKDSSITGHAITFITPDLERTFATHLGAASNFSESDVSVESIVKSRILHLEGYLFEPPQLYDACKRAMRNAKSSGTLISIDLSDPALIERIHSRFEEVVQEYADIIFVNELEAEAFTGKKEADALNMIAQSCSFAVVKLGPGGSIIKHDGAVCEIPAYPADLVNTNGAGDMYAAGALYGICRGLSAEQCGKLGSYGASLVVSRGGARFNGSITVDDIPA